MKDTRGDVRTREERISRGLNEATTIDDVFSMRGNSMKCNIPALKRFDESDVSSHFHERYSHTVFTLQND